MANSIAEHFGSLPDPRRPQGVRHRLSDLLVIAVCGVICAADSWADVADFGNAELPWFRTFPDLPHGVASPDPFERVFARPDPGAFEACFVARARTLSRHSGGRLLAVDGERLRRGFADAWDASTATHLVSVFALENRTAPARLAADCKANEIVAMPKLLALPDLAGATATADAMGGQTAIARQVVDGGGGCVLGVKRNQPALHDRRARDVGDLLRCRSAGVRHGRHRTVDGGHGRVGTRDVWVTDELGWPGPGRDRWPGLRSVGVVGSTREVRPGPATTERRYYISSLAGADAARVGEAVRGRWGIQNRLHHVLDVSSGEDAARHRAGHSAQNFARLRRIALNLLRADHATKRGIKGKRLNAARDHDYLLKLLTG